MQCVAPTHDAVTNIVTQTPKYIFCASSEQQLSLHAFRRGKRVICAVSFTPSSLLDESLSLAALGTLVVTVLPPIAVRAAAAVAAVGHVSGCMFKEKGNIRMLDRSMIRISLSDRRCSLNVQVLTKKIRSNKIEFMLTHSNEMNLCMKAYVHNHLMNNEPLKSLPTAYKHANI
uniref:Uncharacterized protein n=1 Tax=Glossina palpalis gambiensis TaxID=67801 RepID=A0A1B0BBB4_9MUSC